MALQIVVRLLLPHCERCRSGSGHVRPRLFYIVQVGTQSVFTVPLKVFFPQFFFVLCVRNMQTITQAPR